MHWNKKKRLRQKQLIGLIFDCEVFFKFYQLLFLLYILTLCTYKNRFPFAGGPGGVENELRRMGGRLIFVISLCLALLGLVLLYQTHNPSGDVTCKSSLVRKRLIWEKNTLLLNIGMIVTLRSCFIPICMQMNTSEFIM